MSLTIDQLQGETLGLCASGGLDSQTLAHKLNQLGIKTISFTADLAQPDAADINEIQKLMAGCGGEAIVIDLKDEMADACFEVLKAQATYDGGYWNTTGIARAVTVRGLVREMQKHGCTVLAHGATGRGNDQVRFERYTLELAPEMKVYAPWRDPALLEEFPGRTQMKEYLASFGATGFEDGGKKKRYSTDANLAGLSHEAEDLESLETPATIVEPTMGVWPHDAPDAVEEVTVMVESGCVTAINGNTVTPLQAMQLANDIAGRNGIGIRNALENRILGTKSRGVYEAPGMELLGFCILQIYQAVHDHGAAALFRDMSHLIADQIYQGRYFEPATQAARAAVDVLAAHAAGKITLGLYRGNMYFHKLSDCPASLYNEADSSMEASDGMSPISAGGYIEVQNIQAAALAKARQITSD